MILFPGKHEPVTKVELSKIDAYLEARKWERRLDNLAVVGVAVIILGMVIWIAFSR